MLPIAKSKSDAKLIPLEKIPIMKHQMPNSKIYYFEYKYKTLLEERMEKIEKIKNRI